MNVVPLPRREPSGRRALAGAGVLVPFPALRFPVMELAPAGGPVPPVVAPRRERSAPRRHLRWAAVAASALMHAAVLGIALHETAGALSSGAGGVLQVTLVAELPLAPAVLAPKVPVGVPAPRPQPRQDAVPRVPVQVAPPRLAKDAVRPPVPAADAPARVLAQPSVPPVVPPVGRLPAPPGPAGTLAPVPSVGSVVKVGRAARLAPPGRAEALPVVAPAPTAPVPKRARKAPPHKPAQKAAQAGGRARGAGAGAAAGHGGRAKMSAPRAGARALMAGWGARITAGVERHKHYPLAAGVALGTTGVALTVLRDGRLQAVAVARSSGVAALDLAAVQAVRAAAPFPPAPAGLSAPSYAFTLRVKFGG